MKSALFSPVCRLFLSLCTNKLHWFISVFVACTFGSYQQFELFFLYFLLTFSCPTFRSLIHDFCESTFVQGERQGSSFNLLYKDNHPVLVSFNKPPFLQCMFSAPLSRISHAWIYFWDLSSPNPSTKRSFHFSVSSSTSFISVNLFLAIILLQLF